MKKPYIIERTGSISQMEVTMVQYLSEGYLLAGGIAYDFNTEEYIQAVYHPNPDDTPIEYKKGDAFS
jgi:hypothetical protein